MVCLNLSIGIKAIMKNNSKICVVGAGKWGKNHIKTLEALGNLGGIVDTNSNILRDHRKKYPDIKFFDEIMTALDYGFDGFVLATPANTHFAIAKNIIKSGFSVLVEKPITLKSNQAEKLNAMAKKFKVNLMVGHVLLFHPAFKKIKELVENGMLGKLQYIYSNRLNLGTIRTEENVFWSFAPHDIALIQWLTGLFPKKIVSNGLDSIQKGIHDTTITSLIYPNKLMSHIYVSWLHPFKEHRFVVIGSKGMIRFEDSIDGKPLLFYDKSVVWEQGKPIPRNGEIKKINYKASMPLENQLKYFINNLNDTISINNGTSAIDVVKILEKASASLKNENKKK